MQLYNSLKKEKEVFYSSQPDQVGIYCCGPTVYHYAHIGNLRSFLFEDLLRRVLESNGYNVKHIINITDVGHLVSDADDGEDKMEKAKRREGKDSWEIAKFYTEAFLKDFKSLNLLKPSLFTKATDYIEDQIEIIKILEEKGFTYQIADGIYFDSSKIKSYGKLANLDIENLQEGARVAVNPEKRNKTDFALWKFSPKDKQRDMEWKSPWGIGFPGWHTECVAMSLKNLGGNKDYTKTHPFDIHCGGIDHLTVHHPNEMAQTEALAGHQMAEYWLHNEFVILPGDEKMSKSEENFFTLKSLAELAYHPLSYRYLCLGSHYRSKMQFSIQALDGAQRAYVKILKFMQRARGTIGKVNQNYNELFAVAINDDLNSPKALAALWDLMKNEDISQGDSYQTILAWDDILGLRLDEADKVLEELDALQNIPEEIHEMAQERWEAKQSKDWLRADKLRDEIISQGFIIDDSSGTYKVKKNYDKNF